MSSNFLLITGFKRAKLVHWSVFIVFHLFLTESKSLFTLRQWLWGPCCFHSYTYELSFNKLRFSLFSCYWKETQVTAPLRNFHHISLIPCNNWWKQKLWWISPTLHPPNTCLWPSLPVFLTWWQHSLRYAIIISNFDFAINLLILWFFYASQSFLFIFTKSNISMKCKESGWAEDLTYLYVNNHMAFHFAKCTLL